MNEIVPVSTIDGMSATQYALAVASQRLDSIAHNVANASTTAFKREIALPAPFAVELDRATTPTADARVVNDNRQGPLKFTGNKLDLTLEANTFLQVKTTGGIAYTRDGALRLTPDGTLTTHAGEAVMGNQGEIRLTNTEPRIDKSGNVWDGNTLLATLTTVRVENPDSLLRTQGGRYLATESTQMIPSEQPNVQQGYLEASNVVAMDEMVRMIETMRSFEFSQKIMHGYDDMLDKAINVLGQF